MENTFSPLIAELTQIKELMLQLEAQLYYQPFPIELSKSLVSKALLAAEKSICMANKSSFCCPSCGPEGMSPPHSASGSPRSEGSVDHASKFHERREFLKKRKTLPTRRSQVKVGGAESGVETPFDDGYSWRKYGQKDILGAKYPRGYYRCTHKNTQGCPASKQVQRTDEDPTVYDVIYHGVHTCQQRPQSARAKAHEQITHRGPAHVGPLHALQPGLAVKTEGPFGPSSAHEHLNCVPFAFPSTTIESINNNNNNNNNNSSNIYFSCHAWEDCFPGATVGGRFSPSFVSPATSESNYFSPPLRGLRLHKSESDLTEVVSAATSTTNSPMADMDFMLDGLELDPSFHLDASSFFS